MHIFFLARDPAEKESDLYESPLINEKKVKKSRIHSLTRMKESTNVNVSDSAGPKDSPQRLGAKNLRKLCRRVLTYT